MISPPPKSRGATRNSNRDNRAIRAVGQTYRRYCTALNNALNDKIRVTNLGKSTTGLEAFVQSTVDRVLQGDSKGIAALMQLLRKAKLVKPVPNPTRLTGVVVMPADYRRDSELGIEKGSYLFNGITMWVHPVTGNLTYDRPAN